MIHKTYHPGFPLNRFVRNFWMVQCSKQEAPPFKILPDADMELMINFGAPFKVFGDESLNTFELKKNAWVSGPKTKPVLINNLDGYDIVGVKFKKGMAWHFFNFPLSKLTAQVIELDDIWGNLATQLREQLAEYRFYRDRFTKLEQLMVMQLDTNKLNVSNDLVPFSIELIENSTQELGIKKLVRQLGVSHKHFIRKFNAELGISPNMLKRISKFQKAVHLIHSASSIHWTKLSYDCDYYDQSHFIREFKHFTGTNPTKYLVQQGAYLNSVPLGTPN